MLLAMHIPWQLAGVLRMGPARLHIPFAKHVWTCTTQKGKRMPFALQETAARCAPGYTCFLQVMHVRTNQQYIDRRSIRTSVQEPSLDL